MFGIDNIVGGAIGSKLLGGGGSSGGGGGGSSKSAYGKAGAKYLQLLKAYGAGVPDQLKLERDYAPQYTALQLDQMQKALFGQNGAPGYLDLYGATVPELSRVQSTANTDARKANLNDLSTLAPGVLTALRNANPGEANLMDLITQSATEQMQLGTQLDPNQMAEINRMVLGNWSNRGLGTSNPAQLDEALQYFAGGQDLLNRRTQTATNAVNLNQQTYSDPLMAMLGLTSNAPGAGQALTATGAGYGSAQPSIVPTNDAMSMLGGAYTNQANQKIADANNKAAITGAWIGLGGDVLGASGAAAAAKI